MKSFSAIVAIALTIALPAFAQTVADIPLCAQNEVLVGMAATGCSQTDFVCICKNKNFVDKVANSVKDLCTLEETYIVSSFASVFCAINGVSISLPAEVQSPTAAPSTTAATSTSVVVATTTSTSVSVSVSVIQVNGTLSGTPTVTRAILTSSTTPAVTSTSAPAAGAVQTAGMVGLIGAVFVGVMGL